jgi:hypothetical protein
MFRFTESVFVIYSFRDNGISLLSQVADPGSQPKAANVLQRLQWVNASKVSHILNDLLAMGRLHMVYSFL